MPDEPSANAVQGQGETDNSPNSGEIHISPTNSGNDDDARNIRSADKWRYPDDYHVPWLRGKTADQAAQLGQQMFNSMIDGSPKRSQSEYNHSQSEYNQLPQQPAYNPQAGIPQPPTADDWLTDPATATQRQIAYEAQTNFAPRLQQQTNMMAQTSLELARQADKDAFDRWGPEILSQLQTVDQQFWTVPNIKKIVGMVKAEHIDEITTEAVKRRIEQMSNDGVIMRPGSTPTNTSIARADGVDFDIEKLPERYRGQLERARMTPEVLKEFLIKTEVEPRGIPLKQAYDEWFKNASTGDVLLAGDE